MLNNIKTIMGITILIVSHQAYAFNCDTQATGNWEDDSIWINCNGTIPQNDDSVTINASHTVTLSTATNSLESLMVDAGGDINIDFIPKLKSTSVAYQASSIAVINANNTNTSSINLSNVTMDLAKDLTINAQNKDLLLGSVDGGFDLTLMSLGSIDLNENLGSASALNSFNIVNSDGATVTINTPEIKTLGEQKWELNVVLNSPTQQVLMNSSMSAKISLGKMSATFSVRSLAANTDSLLISTTGSIDIMSNIGDNNQALKNLIVDFPSNVLFTKDQLIVEDMLILPGPVTMAKNFMISGRNIDIQNSFDNAGFDLTINTTSSFGMSNIAGVLSGTGAFIKNGTGNLNLQSVNSITGNVSINNGSLFTNNSSENVIPSVPVISVAALGTLSLQSSSTNNFTLQPSQVIKGTGNLSATVIVPSTAVVEPGFSPGQLSATGISMQTDAQLNIEVNGLTVASEYDQLVVNNINLDADANGGTILNVTLANGFVPSVGDSFKIIDVIDPALVVGTFIGLPEAARFFKNNTLFAISYLGGDGNDVVITAVAKSIIYVDANAKGDDGSSWALAFNNLQDALAIAITGDEIWLAQGVYYPDEGAGQTADLTTSTFNLGNGIKLYGGFNGTETDVSMRDPLANVTVLSGDLAQDDTDVDGNGVTLSFNKINGDNAINVLYALNTDDTTLIDGLTITGGNAIGANPMDRGAAIYCGVGSVRINQVIVRGNKSYEQANMSGCQSVITQSSFINNQAGKGAVTTTAATFIDVLFMGNKGIVSTRGAVLNIANVGTLNLTRAKFIGNIGNGPIIKAQSITLDFNEVIFSGNKQSYIGGVLLMSNTTSGTLNNITITGNYLSLDSAFIVGAGITSTTSGDISINNSIIWNNQNINGNGSTLEANIIHTGTGVITVNSSIIQGFTGDPLWDTSILVDGGGNLDEDPLFVMDTDPTMAPTTMGDAHLNTGSPAINSGDNSVVISATDLDGNTRIQNTTVDMGAYEFIGYAVNVTVTGLVAGSVIVQNNGVDDLSFTSNSTQAFSALVAINDSFLVTVLTQPTLPNQSCVVSNGGGTSNGADVDVTVECTIIQYNVGVNVSDLANGNSVIFDNNGEGLTVTTDGSFNFATALDDGNAYDVTVTTQPTTPNQICVVTNGSGTIDNADISVDVACTSTQYNVGVDVSGLANGTIEFDNNGESLTVSANGQFNFASFVDVGSSYDVSIVSQPVAPNQICVVTNGSGIIVGADVLLDVICKDIILVDASAAPLGDGLSWNTAYNNLQDALENPNVAQIWVAQGVYYPDVGGTQVDNEPASTFTLINGVSLYGGFFGTETDYSQRDPSTNITILSGDIDGNDSNGDGNNIAEVVTDIQGNNAIHVLNGQNVTNSTTIDGFTITAGYASSSLQLIGDGAGIYCGNVAQGPSINNVVFMGNRAGNKGGAMFGCSNKVSQTLFQNNRSHIAGAIYAFGGLLETVIFEGNTAILDGGAISNKNNLLTIKHASFKNNVSVISNGGALTASSGNLSIDDTLFLGNSAGIDGGAIYTDNSVAVVLTNITMTGNDAITLGGGIRTESSGTFEIRNSIIWNNRDNTGTGTASSAANSLNFTIDNSFSLIEGFGTAGVGNLDEDPLFISSANPSSAPNSIGNAHLNIGSPAINQGDNSVVISATDLDGNDRIQGSAVDMGAYEYIDLIFANSFE